MQETNSQERNLKIRLWVIRGSRQQRVDTFSGCLEYGCDGKLSVPLRGVSKY